MTTAQMVSALDAEIARLRQVRRLLASVESIDETVTTTVRKVASRSAADSTPRKRILSPEARERIAAAQRARWAAQSTAKGDGAATRSGKGTTTTSRRTAGRSAEANLTDGAEATA